MPCFLRRFASFTELARVPALFGSRMAPSGWSRCQFPPVSFPLVWCGGWWRPLGDGDAAFRQGNRWLLLSERVGGKGKTCQTQTTLYSCLYYYYSYCNLIPLPVHACTGRSG